MGLLDVQFKEPRKPRAYGEANIPMELVKNVQDLLDELGRVPLHVLVVLYYQRFNKLPDFMQIKGGRSGFFDNLKDMIKIETIGHIKYLSLKAPISHIATVSDNPSNSYALTDIQLLLKQKSHLRNGYLFNPNYFLWSGFNDLLKCKDKLRIVPSIFQDAKKLKGQLVDKQAEMIKKAFSKNPQGIYVNEMNLHARIDVKVFGISPPDINSLANEVAELFYRVKSRVGEDILYDGTTRTIPEFQGDEADDDPDSLLDFDAASLVSKAINLGIYQKTLLLIRTAGNQEGLKLNVWARSMKSNWPHDKYIDNFAVYGVKLFVAFNRYKMVDIRSHKDYKNDLRAFLPTVRLGQDGLRQLGLLEFESSVDDDDTLSSRYLYDVSD